MDLRYYFSIIKRRLPLIGALLLVFMVVSLTTTLKLIKSRSAALIFVSIGVERVPGIDLENYNPQAAVDAADRFSETVQGWILNPNLTGRMQEAAKSSFSLSARKQEKQNLLLDLKLTEERDVTPIASAVVTILNEEIKTYNKMTNSTFKLAINSINPYAIKPNLKLNLSVALFLGLFISILMAYLDEYFRGVVSFETQVSKILGVEVFGKISSPFLIDKEGLMGTYLNTLGNKIIIAGVGIDTAGLIIPLVQVMAKYGNAHLALIDFDLEKRSLHRFTQIKGDNLLGVTDLSAKTFSVIGDYLHPISQGIKFLPAGQGTNFTMEVLDLLQNAVNKIVIHTSLPQNSEVLRLPVNDLVLLVKLGQTKEEDLRQIKMIFPGRINFLLI